MLVGDKVRFDGGHKCCHLAADELSEFFEYQSTCPEMAIGLPTPGPALRLVQSKTGEVRLKFSNGSEGDLTQLMNDYSIEYLRRFNQFSGYIVCAKSLVVDWNVSGFYDQ